MSSFGICPVCNSDRRSRLHTIATWQILICDGCAFAHVDPFPPLATRAEFYSKDAIENRAITLERSSGARVMAFVRHWLRRLSGRTKGTILLRELERRVPTGASLLDIGCGSGAILAIARDRYRCEGIEISAHLADQARALGPEVHVGDFVSYPFNARRFDAITMVSLIEHLRDPLQALARCYALLNENGVLILKTVNHGGINRRILGARWSGYRPPDHLVYFSRDNLQRALMKCGFREISFRIPLLNDSFYCYARR